MTAKYEEKFKALKTKLLRRPVARLPNLKNNFILETDASLVALGAVLKQSLRDKNLKHPVAFFRRVLTLTEQNYSVYELKIYAVVRVVEHLRVYLFGREFLLRTDNAALMNLLRRDLPPTTQVQK